MRFLIDAQLPPALCGWFEERGFEAEHVSERLGGQIPDADIAALGFLGARRVAGTSGPRQISFPRCWHQERRSLGVGRNRDTKGGPHLRPITVC
ncbi:MAG TPA: DUF5615 family PIN-like protein [Allosphingosinicella sp.]